MWLKYITQRQMFVAFLLLHYDAMAASAMHNKNQQQVSTLTENQQRSLHAPQTTQHQLQLQQQHQPLQSDATAAHLDKSIITSANSILHASHADLQSLPPAPSSLSTATLDQLPQAHYVVQDKDAAVQAILKHFHKHNAPYDILSELPRDTPDGTNHELPPLVASLPNNLPFRWNLYDRGFAPITFPFPQMTGIISRNFNNLDTFPLPLPATPRFLPFVSYSQSIFVPYPFLMSPDTLYTDYSSPPQFTTAYEESMSRNTESSTRASSSQHATFNSRNSPIYYMRLPPTPYMFLSGLGLGTTAPTLSGYSNNLPYPSLPSFPSFSPIFNVPINFLANGKPSNIYQMSAPPNDLQSALHFSNIPSSFSTRPPPPPPLHAYRPVHSSYNYYNKQPSMSTPSSTSTAVTPQTSLLSQQDSKLTALKHPYYFNGRPEDIYILPNNINPLYSTQSTSFYY